MIFLIFPMYINLSPKIVVIKRLLYQIFCRYTFDKICLVTNLEWRNCTSYQWIQVNTCQCYLHQAFVMCGCAWCAFACKRMSRQVVKKSTTHCKSWWRPNCKRYCAFTGDRSPVEFIALFHKMLNVIDLFVNTVRDVNQVS